MLAQINNLLTSANIFSPDKGCGRGLYGGDGGSRTPVRKHRPLNFLQA